MRGGIEALREADAKQRISNFPRRDKGAGLSAVLVVWKLLLSHEMKALLPSILIRNGLVLLLFTLLWSCFRLIPGQNRPYWLLLLSIFFCLLIWANLVLFKRGHKLAAVLLSVLLVPVIGLPAGISSFLIGRRLVEWKYSIQGMQMVEGCNAAAANTAEFDVYDLENRLVELKRAQSTDTERIAQLEAAQIIAKEKARILADDCGMRGHCDNYPWNTNWTSIRTALAASD